MNSWTHDNSNISGKIVDILENFLNESNSWTHDNSNICGKIVDILENSLHESLIREPMIILISALNSWYFGKFSKRIRFVNPR